MRKNKYVFAVILAMCLMFVCFTPSAYAYASDGGDEILTVTAAWLDGEMLRINVTDAQGFNSSLALSLTDYVNDAENNEFISIQAVDLSGNKSGIVQLKNPYYIPPTEPDNTVSGLEVVVDPETDNENETAQDSQSGIPDGNGLRPFTPSGTGTVMDNANSGDGKEFFTINSEDGNEFYLIIDRQRNFDNVYLLNAVTEQDLVALAAKNGTTINVSNGTNNAVNNGSTSGIPVSGEDAEAEQNTAAEPTPEPEKESPIKANGNNTLIFVLIAVLVTGGVGYYFKIVKGKKNSHAADDDYDDYDEDEDEPEEITDIFSEYENLDADEKEDDE